MADVRLTVTGDTKLLEREIKKALKSGYQLGSLNTRGFSQPLGKIKGQLGEFEKSLEASNARVIAFGASTGAILAVSTALKGMVTSAVQVEKALTDINTILGASSANLAFFLANFSRAIACIVLAASVTLRLASSTAFNLAASAASSSAFNLAASAASSSAFNRAASAFA